MTILLTILKIIGIILLILIALVLLVLFVPVRYRADAGADDPSPHDSFDADYYMEHMQALIKASWLFHFVTVTVQYPGKPVLAVRVAGFTVFTGRKREKKPQEKRETRAEPEKGLREKIQAAVSRIKGIYNRITYYKKALTCKSGHRALGRIKSVISGLLKKVLPGEWEMTGRAGFGDPALAGIFLSVQGMLCPVTGGNMKLDADFQEWILDVHFYAQGSIRIITVISAALKLLFDRDVRKLLHRLRRGPSEESSVKQNSENRKEPAAEAA